MTRFPAAPFVISAMATAALAAAFWHSRETGPASLTRPAASALELSRAIHPAPQSAPDGGVKFADFQKQLSEMGILYLDSLDRDQLASLAASAASLPDSGSIGEEIGTLTARWMELDAAGAVAWTLSLPPGNLRRRALSGSLAVWKQVNAKEAIDWFTARTGRRPQDLLRSDDAALKEQWSEAAAQLMVRDHRPPETIIADLNAVPDAERNPSEDDTPYNRLVQELEESLQDSRQYEKALALLTPLLQDPESPAAALAKDLSYPILNKILPKNPAGVMEWAERHLPNYAQEALGALLYKPEGRQPNAAPWPSAEEVAAWFLRIPRENPGGSPLASLMDSWARIDPDAAGAYLNRQPPGSDKDRALRRMGFWVADSNPEAAMQWAATIRDETLRDETRKDILTKWRRYDPVEANAWVAAEDAGRE
ncbi:MAG TPA: hypothetical protein VG796_27910 [Verrucomicrobiales bacterium]|nr:hypothetical protein [Verrucomicrobiales bacterium]